MKKSEKVIVGLLAGTAAVSILGILVIQAKNTSTGKKIWKEKAAKAKSIRRKAEEVLEMVSDKISTTKESAADLIEKRQERHNETMDDLHLKALKF